MGSERVVSSCNHELQVHILTHAHRGGVPSYTIGIWEGTKLRPICHVRPLSGALLALTKELEGDPHPCAMSVSYPRWADIATVVGRLRQRAETDCRAAAEHLEDLHSRLHRTAGELQSVLERLEKLGAMIEEAAAKANVAVAGDRDAKTVEIPGEIWFRLLGLYRGKQDGNRLYQELKQLREVAGITAETLRTVDEWLGHASTREAAMEALWRLRRILESVGFQMPLEHLEFRGQIIHAMEKAGVGLGNDGELRLRQPSDKNWEPATGPQLKEILQSFVEHAT